MALMNERTSLATQPTPSAAQRSATREDLSWTSWLRFVAICAVVTIHTVAYNAVEAGARETVRGTVAIYLDVLGVFAVPVFVMLSGAFLLDPSRYGGAKGFLSKRALRLVPAIVFWHLWYFALRRLVLDQDLTIGDALAKAVDGELYGALYFFWIVLGLAVVTPVLIPFIGQATRTHVLVAGTAALLMVALSQASLQGRSADDVFVETAWTWWIPYLGYFLLGWALRRVVLRGWRLVAAGLVVVGLGCLMPWHWRNPAAPQWLDAYTPAWYYSVTAMAYSVAIYLVFQSLIRPEGPLRAMARPRMSRLGRTLGDATLGVFVLHLTVLLWVFEWPVIGGDRSASGLLVLLLRVLAVLSTTYVIVLVLRRIPGVKRLV